MMLDGEGLLLGFCDAKLAPDKKAAPDCIPLYKQSAASAKDLVLAEVVRLLEEYPDELPARLSAALEVARHDLEALG
jgi:hypothetical protein